MQLFLHFLKMMQILQFLHTWLRVASGQDRTGEASAGKLNFWEGEFAERFAAEPDGSMVKSRRFAGESGGSHDWDAKNTVLCFMKSVTVTQAKVKIDFKENYGWDLPKENQYGQKASPDVVFQCWATLGYLLKTVECFEIGFLGGMTCFYIDQCTESWFLCFPWLAFSRAFFHVSRVHLNPFMRSFLIYQCAYDDIWITWHQIPECTLWYSYCIYKKDMWNLSYHIYFKSGFFFGENLCIAAISRNYFPQPFQNIKAFRCGWSGRNLVWGAQRYSNEMIALLIMMVNLRNPWSLSQTNHQWKGSMVKKRLDWSRLRPQCFEIHENSQIHKKRTTWDEGCKGQSGKIRSVRFQLGNIGDPTVGEGCCQTETKDEKVGVSHLQQEHLPLFSVDMKCSHPWWQPHL